MNNFNSNYVGIVIQNNDPEKRGRIKVYIPHISASIYEKWYQPEDEDVKDKSFKFMGAEGGVKTSLTRDILDELKEIVPWAECASPLVGSQGAGRYNAFRDVGSISDSSNVNDIIVGTNDVDSATKLNSDNIGESPGKMHELQAFRLHDAFYKTSDTDCNHPNKHNLLSYNYIPNTYSNRSKGTFSIPNVGAHVWVFFKEGDPMFPVYFAVSHGQEDWRGIYESNLDYPASYENVGNKDKTESDIDTDTYRNKMVINQKAGVIELVNTDNKEMLKFTHFSGSFKEFNNMANIELAVKNDQKMVLEDQFLTVKGFKNEFTAKDFDAIIKGNMFTKIGELNRDTHLEWRETVREIALIKQLFEIQRAENIHKDEDNAQAELPFRKTSNAQKKVGTPAPCPVCTDPDFSDFYWNVNNSFTTIEPTVTNSSGNKATEFSTTKYKTVEAKWQQETTGGSIYDQTCPVCEKHSRKSPSSMNGQWNPDPEKEKFQETLKEVAEKLVDIERKLGRGGSEIKNVAKHKTETIGLVMNDFGSIRVDPVGKMYRNEVIIHPQGTFNSQAATPLVEYVHVDDLPGGTYNLNICNKFNILVGAGGVNLKSYGPVDIGGTITNIVGEQVNVASQNEVNISGGKRTSITGDNVILRQTNRGQVLVDSNLGVTQNVIVGGGAYFEGETHVQHVTAPCEIQETEIVKLFGKLLKGLKFSATISSTLQGSVAAHSRAVAVGGKCTITLASDSNDDKVKMYDHSHNFKNLPLTLKGSNSGVRNSAQECNKPKRVKANSIEKVPASQKNKN
jgi:hypothetical protein